MLKKEFFRKMPFQRTGLTGPGLVSWGNFPRIMGDACPKRESHLNLHVFHIFHNHCHNDVLSGI